MKKILPYLFVFIILSSCVNENSRSKSRPGCIRSYYVYATKREFRDSIFSFYEKNKQMLVPVEYFDKLRFHYKEKYHLDTLLNKEYEKGTIIRFEDDITYSEMDADSVNFNFHFGKFELGKLTLWIEFTDSQNDWNKKGFELCLTGYTYGDMLPWSRVDKIESNNESYQYSKLIEDSVLNKLGFRIETMF